MRNLIATAGLLASLTVAEGAFAQTTTASSASASGQANVGVSLPGATTTSVAVAGTSDHDQMVGRLAVGYFGIANVGAGANTGAGGPNDSPYSVTGLAPVVGVRYWISPLLGLDVGLGLSLIGGSVKPPDPAVRADRTSFTGFIIHGGVPLALASTGSFAFEVIPELNVGIGHAGTDNPATPGDTSYSGFHFDVGARVGAEISFGFIKLPQLSLVGSVGVRFDTDSGNTNDTEVPPMGAPAGKSSSSRSEFHTTVGPNPWAIFTNQIAALYYF